MIKEILHILMNSIVFWLYVAFFCAVIIGALVHAPEIAESLFWIPSELVE